MKILRYFKKRLKYNNRVLRKYLSLNVAGARSYRSLYNEEELEKMINMFKRFES